MPMQQHELDMIDAIRREAKSEGRLAALREFQKGFEGAEGYSTCEEAYDALQTMIAKEEGKCQP